MTIWFRGCPNGTIMVPYGTIRLPPLTMMCPVIHDKRRPLSATRLRKKRDVVCHLRGFNVFICFSWILQEGCLKMLSSSANHFLFFVVAKHAKVGVSPRRFAKFAFERFFAILCLGQCAKSTFFLPLSIKMYVFILLLDVVNIGK